MNPSHAAVAFAVLVGCYSTASAQIYPSRPLILVVPYAVGGPADTVARILAERMRQPLGQPVVVENPAGAGGTIGAGRVARSAPDGYTILLGNRSTHVVNAVVYALKYDVIKDFDPIALIGGNPQLIVSRSDVPAKDLKEFVAWVGTNQDKVSAGDAGIASSSHLGGIFFQNVTGTRFQFVHYRGTAPALQELIAGRIELMFDQASNSLPHVRTGKIKAYAVMANTRLPAAPEIPTVDEAGVPGLHFTVWWAIWAPRGTPADAVTRLNAAVVEGLSDLAVRKRLGDLGYEIAPRDQQTPQALAALQKQEIEKWWPMIKAVGIKLE